MKADERKQLEVRLSTVMIYLETNWEGLAELLGVTRQTVTAVKSGKKNLGPEPLRKLRELESRIGLITKETSNPLNQQNPSLNSACCQCQEKDEEISYLREALAKANENLSGMIELMQEKNTYAGPASIASSGLDGLRRDNNKKGA